jgi:hypothetical protein
MAEGGGPPHAAMALQPDNQHEPSQGTIRASHRSVQQLHQRSAWGALLLQNQPG